MSRQSLSNFLKKLDKELQGTSKPYRDYTANKRTQTFIYLPRVLKEELYNEFEFRNLTSIFNTNDFQKYLTTKTNNILAKLRQNAQSMKNSRNVKIISNANFISVTLQKETNPTSKSPNSTLYNNFSKLQTLYKDEIDLFVKDLVVYLEEEYNTTLTTTKREGRFDDTKKRYVLGQKQVVTNKRVTKGADLFEGGHEKGEGILETRMRDALTAALNEGYLNKAETKALQQNLKLLGIDISVIRDDSNDSHTFKIESKVRNQQDGILLGDAKQRLEDQLKEAILRLDSETPIAKLKGSDSVIERKNKKTLQKIAKPFSKINGVVLQGFEKPKNATRRSSMVSKSPPKSSKKEAVGISKVSIPSIKTRRNIQKGISSNPLMLIGLINQKLPQTVQKNMREPNLVNRSGRFAQSARVVDVITTPQGYLSFGYTYMKNPYQTFEAGFAQGDVDRDPRNILDQSIREIAVQFALGRFYTRRV